MGHQGGPRHVEKTTLAKAYPELGGPKTRPRNAEQPKSGNISRIGFRTSTRGAAEISEGESLGLRCPQLIPPTGSDTQTLLPAEYRLRRRRFVSTVEP